MNRSQDDFTSEIKKKINELPNEPGVYKFLAPDSKGKAQLLYIGKATSLKSRVRSYFAPDIIEKRSYLIGQMVREATDIQYEKTDSVLEALILESVLIKKHLPPYNVAGKDQKSWNYVVITREKYPRVLLVRGRNLFESHYKPLAHFGPFPHSMELKEAMKIVRRIFPYRDKCEPNQGRPCFNYQIGLCPGACVGAVTEQEYKRNIRQITKFFSGKKKQLLKELEKEMKRLAKEKKFEEAGTAKRKIFALKHIEDVALIKKDREEFQHPEEIDALPFRIEAYDIAHTSGQEIVGVITVVEGGKIKKSDYRLFKIRNQGRADPTSPRLRGASDTKALKEILYRRFRHSEWRYPNLIVVDGGIAQLNAATGILKQIRPHTELDFNIPIVAVTKNIRHKPERIQTSNLKSQNFGEKYEKEILLANAESHRFAITFHRKRRDKLF